MMLFMQGILPTSRSPGGRGGLARGGGRGYIPSIGRGTRGYYGRSRGYRGRGIFTTQRAYHLNLPRIKEGSIYVKYNNILLF